MTKKKVLASVGTIALTAALAIGGTLAYMGQVTETKKNEFSSTTKIIPKLEEEFNEDEARKYIPGKPIVKKPTVKNEATSTEAMIAGLVLSYEWAGETVELSAISNYIDIAWTTMDSWGTLENGIPTPLATDVNGVSVYRYGKVNIGESTPEIFSAVTVKANIMELLIKEQYDELVKESVDSKMYKIVPSVPEDGTEDVDYIKVETSRDEEKVTYTVYQVVNKDQIDSVTKYYTQTEKNTFKEITYPNLPSFAINVTGLGVQEMGDEKAENEALLDLATKAGFVK